MYGLRPEAETTAGDVCVQDEWTAEQYRRGEPQGSVLRCELTNLFDIISSKQRGGEKRCLLHCRQGKRARVLLLTAHFSSLSYTSYFSWSVVFHSQNPSPLHFSVHHLAFTSLPHGRRSYSVMRALHADSHNSSSPRCCVILESC